MAVIRTVLGDVPAEDAGVVLTHEHTLIFWPGADIDHRSAFDHDDVVAGLSEEFKLGTDLFGLRTLVDCTTTEMGRHPRMMCEASRRSGRPCRVGNRILLREHGNPLPLAAPVDRRNRRVLHPRHHRRHRRDGRQMRDHQGLVGPGRCVPEAESGRSQRTPTSACSKIACSAPRARAQKATGVPITTHIDPSDWQVCKYRARAAGTAHGGGAPDPAQSHHRPHLLRLDRSTRGDPRARPPTSSSTTSAPNGAGCPTTPPWRCSRQAIDRGYVEQLLLTFDRFWYQMRARQAVHGIGSRGRDAHAAHVSARYLHPADARARNRRRRYSRHHGGQPRPDCSRSISARRPGWPGLSTRRRYRRRKRERRSARGHRANRIRGCRARRSWRHPVP